MFFFFSFTDQFQNHTDVVKEAMSFGSPIMPGLLGGLWNESKKVRKKIMKCFSVCLEKPVSRTNYAPLIKSLVANKAAIIATSDNIVDIIKVFTEEARSCKIILEMLLEKALDCDELLMKLAPIFSFVGKNGIIQIGMHLTSALSEIENNLTKKLTIQTIMQNNGEALIGHIEEIPVWEAFVSGLNCQSNVSVLHNGIEKLPSCVFIDTMSENIGIIVTKKERLTELFNLLIDLSSLERINPEHLFSARNVILDILPLIDDSILIQVLYDVWGEDFFVKTKRSIAKSKKLPAGHTENQSLKWQKTVFFIEVSGNIKLAKMSSMLQPMALLLKKALHEQDQQDYTYILELLISCMLNIVDNFNQAEKEANPIDPELIVQCIR